MTAVQDELISRNIPVPAPQSMECCNTKQNFISSLKIFAKTSKEGIMLRSADYNSNRNHIRGTTVTKLATEVMMCLKQNTFLPFEFRNIKELNPNVIQKNEK